MLLKSMLVDLISTQWYFLCVVFVNEMFFKIADDTGPVWESILPLFFSSPSSSLAYISSINPILGGLLWSLCVLWAMVIICLLSSRFFMCLVCCCSSHHSILLSISLALKLKLACSYCLCLLLVLHPCPLSLPPTHLPLLLYNIFFICLSSASFTFCP